MNLHDRLLDALRSIATVRLVAALRDDRLNFPDPDDLRVFIPDIHLVSAERRQQAGFLYDSNFLPLLRTVVESLRALKRSAGPGERMVVYQIGDLFDLWRESDGLDPDLDVAAGIKDSHEDLVGSLMDPDLNMQFLLGNHDYDLFRFANFSAWERYFCLSPAVILLHGDIFDWAEKFPLALKDLVVFLFSPHVRPSTAQLERMRPLNQHMRGNRTFTSFVQNESAAPIGLSRDTGHVPQSWNVQVEGVAADSMLTYLDAARQKCREADQQFGTALRVAVIGHTHHARIAVRESAGDFFALIDCGAWIENCKTADDPTPQPNAQIAALGANEARIYQLAPRP